MNSMNYLGKFISNFRYVYNEINAATLTGAIDVVVVEQPDGSYTCSPFHVRFGKIGVLRSKEKVVDIEINGEPVDIHMKLGESGEAFFVEAVSPEEEEDGYIPPHLACSPIPVESSFSERFRAERENSKEDWPVFRHNGDQGNDVVADGEDEEEKPVIVLANNLAKTFKAETVESAENKDIVRKLSTVSGEFRPISGSRESDAMQTSQLSLNTTDLNVDDSTSSDRVSSSVSSSKRKRRKKSLMKKKNSNSSNIQKKSQCQGELQPVEANTEAINLKQESEQPTIFAMEDIDQSQIDEPKKVIMNDDNNDVLINDNELSRMQSSIVESDLHFFSDTEITPGCRATESVRKGKGFLVEETLQLSAQDTAAFEVITASQIINAFPHEGRQYTPVQSDTEFETKRMANGAENAEGNGSEDAPQSWRWGELPTSSHEEANKQDADAHRSMLHNMLGFMKKTKHIRHNPEGEGIYLSDLNADELDPEVAALYFPSSYKQGQQRSNAGGSGSGPDEDAESGNGPSLPHSPHSVEGAVCGPKSLDSDFEEPKHRMLGDIAMSVCGGMDKPEGPSEAMFQDNMLSYEDLVENPGVLENPHLVVRLDGKMYRWQTACPIIMTQILFNKSLPTDVVSKLLTAPPIAQEKRKGSRRGYSSWFTWVGRNTDTGVNSKQSFQPEISTIDSTEACDASVDPKDKSETSDITVPSQVCAPGEISALDGNESVIITEYTEKPTDDAEEVVVQVTGFTKPVEDDLYAVTPKDIPRRASQISVSLSLPAKKGQYPVSSDSESEGEHNQRTKQLTKTSSLTIPLRSQSDKYRKTLRLTSEQISKLHLRDGANEVEFSVTTAYQGTSRCKCFLFRWRYDDKIVISDIDGTITRSDVLGHILPIMGKDWAQSGVAKLFTKIKNNGYKLLYLSARAIGQSRLTRDYLKSIKQEDISLPDGPILLNPTSLLTAFHTEVIEKKPEEFKISCLRDIQALFPPNTKPFYAGYGNKINDVWAYQAVGVPIFRIFTINHRGELKHELTQTFQSSYSNLSYIVDQMFPVAPTRTVMEDYSQFCYWRDPIPELDPELEKQFTAVSASPSVA